jgi:hypothetical protein
LRFELLSKGEFAPRERRRNVGKMRDAQPHRDARKKDRKRSGKRSDKSKRGSGKRG